jgi:hypothetical protein
MVAFARRAHPEPPAGLDLVELFTYLRRQELHLVTDGARLLFQDTPHPLLNDGLVRVLQRHRGELLQMLPRTPGPHSEPLGRR